MPIGLYPKPAILTVMVAFKGKWNILEEGEQRPALDWRLKDKKDYKLWVRLSR